MRGVLYTDHPDAYPDYRFRPECKSLSIGETTHSRELIINKVVVSPIAAYVLSSYSFANGFSC